MNELKKRKNRKKGFTLAELLIVVAIIGILAVIAIPIFTAQLEKSKENADITNLRAAKAAAATEYLTSSSAASGKYFDAGLGKIVDSKPKTGYLKGTATKGGCAPFALSPTTNYTESTDAEGKVIGISWNADGEITLSLE